MLDWILQVFYRNTETIVVSVFVSSLVSHWFSIRRDRRIEINEIADALDRRILIDEQGKHAALDFEEADIDSYLRRASWYRRRQFEKALNDYRAATAKTEYRPGGTVIVIEEGNRDKRYLAAERMKKVLRRL